MEKGAILEYIKALANSLSSLLNYKLKKTYNQHEAKYSYFGIECIKCFCH
jgi:hypothetical protein